jgi:hypothetical protein
MEKMDNGVTSQLLYTDTVNMHDFLYFNELFQDSGCFKFKKGHNPIENGEFLGEMTIEYADKAIIGTHSLLIVSTV